MTKSQAVYLVADAHRVTLLPARTRSHARDQARQDSKTKAVAVRFLASQFHQPDDRPSVEDDRPAAGVDLHREELSILLLTCTTGQSSDFLSAEIVDYPDEMIIDITARTSFYDAWSRPHASPIDYLRRLIGASLGLCRNDVSLLASLLCETIQEENLQFIRNELRNLAVNVMPDSLRAGEYKRDLRLLKNRLGHIQLSENPTTFDRVGFRQSLEMVSSQLDSLATWMTVSELHELTMQERARVLSREREQRVEKDRENLLQRSLESVNRRVTVLGALFILPGLWFAYWGLPSAPGKLMGFAVTSPAGQMLLIAIAMLLAFLGSAIGWQVTRVGSDQRETS